MGSMRSPVAKFRGLGSAHDGVHHFWVQRLSGIALVPLLLWFVFSLTCHAGSSYNDVIAWIQQPFTAVLLILTIMTVFYHSDLGLQTVVEDYVHGKGAKLLTLVTLKFLHVVLATTGVFAVLKIAFTAVAVGG